MWSGGATRQTEPPVETFRGTSPYKRAAKGRASSEPRNISVVVLRSKNKCAKCTFVASELFAPANSSTAAGRGAQIILIILRFCVLDFL
jgi:hypothetical protein